MSIYTTARTIQAKLTHKYNVHVRPLYDPVYKRMIPAYKAWVRDNEGNKLKNTFSLPANAMILDVGAYVGDWAEPINAAHPGATIHLFEAHAPYAEQARRRFAGNPRIHVHAFGLADADGTVNFHVLGEGTSAFRNGGQVATAQLRDVAAVLNELQIGAIDLVKMNIEGGEYPLLDRMIDAAIMRNVDQLLIQFHNVGDDPFGRYEALRRKLEKTHRLEWQYFFCWEKWIRRK